MWIRTSRKRSPRPSPADRRGHRARRAAAGCPAGLRAAAVRQRFPESVGTSMRPPSVASASVSGKGQTRLSPRRSTTGWGVTSTCSRRSPAGSPGSRSCPCPSTTTVAPSEMPAGTRATTRTDRIRLPRPPAGGTGRVEQRPPVRRSAGTDARTPCARSAGAGGRRRRRRRTRFPGGPLPRRDVLPVPRRGRRSPGGSRAAGPASPPATRRTTPVPGRGISGSASVGPDSEPSDPPKISWSAHSSFAGSSPKSNPAKP